MLQSKSKSNAGQMRHVKTKSAKHNLRLVAAGMQAGTKRFLKTKVGIVQGHKDWKLVPRALHAQAKSTRVSRRFLDDAERIDNATPLKQKPPFKTFVHNRRHLVLFVVVAVAR